MIVYAYYNPEPTAPREQARFIRLWSQSWRKWGWTPKLLTERMAEEHPGYAKHCTFTSKALLAVHYFDQPGLLVRSNMINFGLEPKRLAAGGKMIYPGVVAISKATIREMAKTRCTRYTLDYTFKYFTSDIKACLPVRVFSDWDSEEVMEALRC